MCLLVLVLEVIHHSHPNLDFRPLSFHSPSISSILASGKAILFLHDQANQSTPACLVGLTNLPSSTTNTLDVPRPLESRQEGETKSKGRRKEEKKTIVRKGFRYLGTSAHRHLPATVHKSPGTPLPTLCTGVSPSYTQPHQRRSAGQRYSVRWIATSLRYASTPATNRPSRSISQRVTRKQNTFALRLPG